MLNRIVMISLGAAIVLAPLTPLAPAPALAQTDQSVAPAKPAPSTGPHRRHLRHQANVSRERARASAKHMHQPAAAPQKAP